MKRRRYWRQLAAIVVLTGGLASFGSTGASASSSQGGQFNLPARPAWASAASAQNVVPATTPESAKVWLASRPGLAEAARAVSDPKSSQFHHYLTAQQVRDQYAPTDDQVSAVTGWLTGAGLTVDKVGADNFYVQVSGTAAAVNKAFGTTLSLFVINGKAQQAPSTDLAIPSSVASKVIGVTGLTTFGHIVKPADLGNPDAFVNGTECSSAYGTLSSDVSLPKFKGKRLPMSICGYTPPQVRNAYAVPSWGDGQGVGITDAFDSSHLESDANTYADRNDGGNNFNTVGSFTDLSVGEASDPNHPTAVDDCGGNGWYGEQSLDVEAIHGMAPMANIYYYGAASCYDDDFLAQFAQIVSDDSVSIVSNSWGEPIYVLINGIRFPTIDSSLIADYETVLQSGALEGIGFYFSSGDEGDEVANTGVKSPDYPASDPWVTAVGGTSLAADGNGNRIFESGWGTAKYSQPAPVAPTSSKPSKASWILTIPFQYGAGGGFTDTTFFTQPYYQGGIVGKNPTGGRAVPDIAADADPTTGFLVGEAQGFPATDTGVPQFNVPPAGGSYYGELREGGTSLASPLIAGMQADVQGNFGSFFLNGFGWIGTIGFANPMLYALDKSSFYDVQKTHDSGNIRQDWANGINGDDGELFSVRTFNQDSSLKTNKGWDDVTGRGTPNGGPYTSNIENYLCGYWNCS